MSDIPLTLDLKTKHDQATRQAVEVLKKANPLKIIRFGSAAWGTLHAGSDLDLCVVVERADERPLREVRRDLNRLLWAQYRPGDVEIELHVYYRDTFEDYLRREDPFLYEVVKGQVVYEAPGKAHELVKEPSAAYGPSRFAELAQIWLETAAQDLTHARSALEFGFFSHTCFSCQQAAEKALKAYLYARRQSLVRTHDLVKLLNRCVAFDKSFEELGEICVTLNEYYADTRYPDTLKFGTAFTQEESDGAVAYAERAVEFIRLRVEDSLNAEVNHGNNPKD
jgi:HEPN domain-containing protein/predicted nucleotidyltransferase